MVCCVGQSRGVGKDRNVEDTDESEIDDPEIDDPEIDDDVVWRRAPDVLWRQLTDGVIVLSPGDCDDQPTFVQGSGATVWELLATATTLPHMVGALADAFGADPSLVRADVEPVLLVLEQRGAIERVPAPRSGSEP